MTYYKCLKTGGKSAWGGTGTWHVPNGKPGKWMPKIVGKLVPCECGYHICTADQLVYWLSDEIYEVECSGATINCDNKSVVQRARLIRKLDTWNERTARLFACDCAERALTHVAEPDRRSVEAIRVARLHANGKTSTEELRAAYAAAYAAARVAYAARAAHRAAEATERKWQADRLKRYLEIK